MVTRPETHSLQTGGDVMSWRFDAPLASLSSASVGGGWSHIEWVTNVGVGRHYDRVDLHRHADEVSAELDLVGDGATLFTAADLGRAQASEDDGLRVDATVGIAKPTWAADDDLAFTLWRPGTINIVVQLAVALVPEAAVNAVMTITEAKSQALFEADIPGTGTASDAVVVCWPITGPAERFAGPRSPWGARIARATHAAVASGIDAAP